MDQEREKRGVRKTLVVDPKPLLSSLVIQGKEEPLTYVGKRIPMVGALEKARGKAVYYSDLELPGMLHAKILRSPHAHARILNINADKALSLPGVKAVLLPQHTPTDKYGVLVLDRNVLARERVRFVGEEVAAVAAVDEETAEEAIRLIQVEYEPLPPLFDVKEALQEGSPLIHEDKPGNIAYSSRIVRGDIERGWRDSDVVMEEVFQTQFVHALCIEPHICVADITSSGNMILYLATQNAFSSRNTVAKLLKIPLNKIKVVQTHVGGGFGAKLDTTLHLISALLAQKTGKPVRLANTREEDISSTYLRVPVNIRLKLGAKRDGTLIAKQVRILADNGAYSSLAPKLVCTNMSIRSDCLYHYQHVLTESTLVYTNKIPTSAIRGYGNVQITFAQESLIDMLAKELGIDPVQFRLKNGTRTGDTTIHGWKIASCGLQECLEEGAKQIGWKKKSREKDSRKLRGLGVASMIHVSGNRGRLEWDGSEVIIRLQEDGTAVVFSGESELGQGKDTVLTQIAAESIGLSLADVQMGPVDTDICPWVLGSSSSKTTVLAGNAVKNAGEKIRKQLLETASKMLNLPVTALKIKESRIYAQGEKDPKLTVKEVAQHAHSQEGRQTFLAHGVFEAGKVRVGPYNEYYGDISATYPFAAHFAEVEVDRQTGEVAILRYVAAHDVGKAINPMAVEGQIEGGVAQGIGYALMEEIVFDPEGKIQNPNLQDYYWPTALDIPPVEPILIESMDPVGPYGAKGVGEPTVIPVAPAIANALYDATGVRFTELPMTSEKICLALKKREKPTFE